MASIFMHPTAVEASNALTPDQRKVGWITFTDETSFEVSVFIAPDKARRIADIFNEQQQEQVNEEE